MYLIIIMSMLKSKVTYQCSKYYYINLAVLSKNILI